MNECHLTALASDAWRELLEAELLPWVLADVHLGDHLVEIGPGPGLDDGPAPPAPSTA